MDKELAESMMTFAKHVGDSLAILHEAVASIRKRLDALEAQDAKNG